MRSATTHGAPGHNSSAPGQHARATSARNTRRRPRDQETVNPGAAASASPKLFSHRAFPCCWLLVTGDMHQQAARTHRAGAGYAATRTKAARPFNTHAHARRAAGARSGSSNPGARHAPTTLRPRPGVNPRPDSLPTSRARYGSSGNYSASPAAACSTSRRRLSKRPERIASCARSIRRRVKRRLCRLARRWPSLSLMRNRWLR